MYSEAQIDAANSDLDAFSRDGSAIGPSAAITDRMHALLVMRADTLEGCTEGAHEEAELAGLVDPIEAYEPVRWPMGKSLAARGKLRPNMELVERCITICRSFAFCGSPLAIGQPHQVGGPRQPPIWSRSDRPAGAGIVRVSLMQPLPPNGMPPRAVRPSV
jgi:hypothetical protein